MAVNDLVVRECCELVQASTCTGPTGRTERWDVLISTMAADGPLYWNSFPT